MTGLLNKKSLKDVIYYAEFPSTICLPSFFGYFIRFVSFFTLVSFCQSLVLSRNFKNRLLQHARGQPYPNVSQPDQRSHL